MKDVHLVIFKTNNFQEKDQQLAKARSTTHNNEH